MVQKAFPTVGCCGLDCGLCPRYYTEGNSRCPGCCGPDFFSKHPSCSFITCCVKKKNFEACGECDEFPCSKFDNEAVYDSFITHRKTVINSNFIKENGTKAFIKQQKNRIGLLKKMLDEFDDGRSKSFYCLATTLLSITGIEKSLKHAYQKIKTEAIASDDRKAKSQILKPFLNAAAEKEKVELKLRKK